LFPSYLFVRVTPEKSQWRPVLSTYGVRKVVRFGDDVPYLDARFVETLQAREVDGAIVKPREPYAPGQDIRIVSGPFDGLIAKIIDVRENDRLVILMDLLGQSVRGRIHADQVSPLGAS
jgi:transcriptional antiterminator RfaH